MRSKPRLIRYVTIRSNSIFELARLLTKVTDDYLIGRKVLQGEKGMTELCNMIFGMNH